MSPLAPTPVPALANTDSRRTVSGWPCGQSAGASDSLIGRRTSIQGWPSGVAADSEDTLAFSARGEVRPMVETFPLEQAAAAYARMMSGAARFRVVLTMGA